MSCCAPLPKCFFQNRDLTAVIQIVLYHTVQRRIARRLRPSRRSQQFLVAHLRHRRAKLRPALAQILERPPPFHFAHLPHRRPIHLGRHVNWRSRKTPMHDPVPSPKMIHNFPNRMRPTHRMHRSLLSRNPLKQLIQRRPMPRLSRNRSIHLVQYPRNFAHLPYPASPQVAQALLPVRRSLRHPFKIAKNPTSRKPLLRQSRLFGCL
jgi:hypothetical protein